MTYSADVLAHSPLAYWRLGEASGTVAEDASPNNRDGTYVSTPTLGATGLLVGDADTAMQVAANSGECMSIASAAWMNVSTITVIAMVKFTSAVDASNGDAIVSRWSSGGFDWKLWRDAGGKLSAQLSNGSGATKTLTGTFTPTNGTAYHVAMTYDGSTMTVYADGAAAGSLGSMGGGIFAGGTPIEVGRSSQTFSTVPGAVLDEVAIIGSALTATDIADLSAVAHGGAGGGGSEVALGRPVVTATANPLTVVNTHHMDVSNAANLRQRTMRCDVDITYPVAPVPAGVSEAVQHDAVVAYPQPTMVDGRPT